MKVDRRTLDTLTEEAIKKGEIPGVEYLIKASKDKGILTSLSTTGYDEIGFVSNRIFNNNIRGFVASPIIWATDDGREIHGPEIVVKEDGKEFTPVVEMNALIRGCYIPVKSPEDKMKANVEMAKILSLNEKEVGVIGNDYLDHPSMKRFGLAIASPLADEETTELVRDLDGIYIKDYVNASVELLKNYHPRNV